MNHESLDYPQIRHGHTHTLTPAVTYDVSLVPANTGVSLSGVWAKLGEKRPEGPSGSVGEDANR